ncbi:polysaccharide lyase [Salipiger sp. P9]|nr:polysaccharide lyase [Salipiger pentaromativorans]
MRHLFLACLFLIFAVSASIASAQSGFGKFDRDAARGSTMGITRNIAHPSGTAVRAFSLPGGACRGDDCRNDRERAELIESRTANLEGHSYRYTFSVFFPADTPDVGPTNLIFWQVKPHGTGKPSITMELVGNDINFVLHDPSRLQGDRMNPLRPVVIRRVARGVRGRWQDFVLDVHWSKRNDGRIVLKREGREVLSHNGPNIDSKSSRQRVRYGLYRSFLSRYLQRNGGSKLPTQTAYFANITRAPL